MIKLVAIDMDGTTLDNDSKLHPQNIETIKMLKEQGVKFIIATGRPYRSSVDFYNTLGLDTPLINYNGQYIHHPLDPNFKEKIYTINRSEVLKIENDLKEYLNNIMCEYEDKVYVDHLDDMILKFFWSKDDYHEGKMNEVLDMDPCTFIIEAKSENCKEYISNYMKNFPNYKFRFWSGKYSNYGELIPLGVNKASGIRYTLEYLNIQEDEVLVIGDAGNDEEMLREFKESCCMKNGDEVALKASKYISKYSNDEGGVSQFLKEYFQK